ncbi:ComF family protein [Patescibacteria group bacterium]|nr:ComF family protein [Patescibacteria group bacterium]
MKKLLNIVLNLIFPQKCLGCGKENETICPKCLAQINFPSLIEQNNIFSAADYNDEVIKKTLWQLKYKGRKGLSEPLAELIFQRLKSKITWSDWLIIPVPLHKNRLKARGFNQSELIAQKLAEKIQTSDVGAKNIGCLTNVLYKIKETPAQVSIKNRKDRLRNLQGAFEVKNPELIQSANILLIDDISTTGATMKECKKILRSAGAKKIIGIVVARG